MCLNPGQLSVQAQKEKENVAPRKEKTLQNNELKNCKSGLAKWNKTAKLHFLMKMQVNTEWNEVDGSICWTTEIGYEQPNAFTFCMFI